MGPALQGYARSKLLHTVEKYFSNAIDANVIFEKTKSFFKAEIKVHEKTKRYAIADSEDSDIHKSFDLALKNLTLN